MSDSLQSHGLYSPWNSPGQNTGVGSLSLKGTKGMNEIGPHKNWAEKIMMRAQAYGVIDNDASYIELFGV